MGITSDIFSVVKAPKQMVVVAVTRKRREQLEYIIQTTLTGAHVTRARNGTKFELANKSVVITQVQGSQEVDVDTTNWKAKEWKAWISDIEPEEEKKSAKTK